jgi:hypothetical protein
VPSTGEDFAALLKKMDTGLLVTELLGQGLNMVTGDYSRGAAGFWVENGVIAYPVEEITVAGNLKDMFRGIVALGTDLETRGSRQVGSILIDRMTVAGDVSFSDMSRRCAPSALLFTISAGWIARGIDRLNGGVGRAVKWLVLLATLVSAGNALMRYGFDLSSNAWLELQWYLFALIFLLGAGYTHQHNGHVRIDVLYGRFSPQDAGLGRSAWRPVVPAAHGGPDRLARLARLHDFLGRQRNLAGCRRPVALAHQAGHSPGLRPAVPAGAVGNHQARRLPRRSA